MKRVILLFAALCAVLVPARATTTFSISPASITVNPGDSADSFDVVLTNNGPSTISVAGFAFEVTVADTDVTLLGATYATALPYIFDGDSFDQANAASLESFCSCPYSLSIFDNVDTTNQTLVAGDITNDGAGIMIASGASVGLGHVLFDVAPGAAFGQFALSFTGNASGVVGDSNSLSDANFNAINVDTFSNGNLSAVPEPTSLALIGLALLSGLGIDRRRSLRG